VVWFGLVWFGCTCATLAMHSPSQSIYAHPPQTPPQHPPHPTCMLAIVLSRSLWCAVTPDQIAAPRAATTLTTLHASSSDHSDGACSSHCAPARAAEAAARLIFRSVRGWISTRFSGNTSCEGWGRRRGWFGGGGMCVCGVFERLRVGDGLRVFEAPRQPPFKFAYSD